MNKKRLAAAGIVALGLMLTSSIVFTVAWYSGASNLSVNSFNVRLADKELDISTDDIEFKEILTEDDLEKVERYKPVSSAFSSEWINSKELKPQFVEGYSDPMSNIVTSRGDVNIAENGFFSQTLYLKCNSIAKVSFDKENTYVKPDVEKNEEVATKIAHKYPNLTHEQIVENLNNVVNSIRISLLVLNDTDSESLDDYTYKIVDPTKQGTTKLGGLLDTDLDGYYDSFDNKEVIYGEVYNATDSTLAYDEEITSDESASTSNSQFDASHQKGVRPLNLDASKNGGVEIATEESLSLDELDEFSFDLKADVSKKIVLSLYIEGWDLDSVNYNMNSCFLTNITFKLADGGK